MPRSARVAFGGMVFQVINRGVGRMELFSKDADYEAFEEILEVVLDVAAMRVCNGCLTPNHWHFVLWPERNALRAGLTARAEAWRWCGLWRRTSGTGRQRKTLSTWPLPRPRAWKEIVNEPQTEAEREAIRRSVARGQPFGSDAWVQRTAKKLGLESTLRPLHRPKQERTTKE